jgi:hypothetical protein
MSGTTLIRSNKIENPATYRRQILSKTSPRKCHNDATPSIASLLQSRAGLRQYVATPIDVSHFNGMAPYPSWNRVGSEPETGGGRSFLHES